MKSFSTEIFARNIPIPRHCGDTERGVPYDDNTCGVPRLQPPTNVTVHCNETHTNISWNRYIRYIKPNNSHSLIKSENFYLTVNSDNTELEFVVFNASSVTLNTTAAMNITLYGYTRCSGLLELRLRRTSATGYSLPVHTSNIGPETCCENSTCDAKSSIIHPLYMLPFCYYSILYYRNPFALMLVILCYYLFSLVQHNFSGILKGH